MRAFHQTIVSIDTFVQFLQVSSSGLIETSASRPVTRESREAILSGAKRMIPDSEMFERSGRTLLLGAKVSVVK